MPTPAERLALLLEVHGDSYRSAAERCGLDHTTLVRVGRGETENPATLTKIAEGYGVPMVWLQGERDLTVDFACAVLVRPVRERILFMWDPGRRLAFTLAFLLRYDPQRYADARLASLLQVDGSRLTGILEGATGPLPTKKVDRFYTEVGLPATWLQAGLVGREDEQEMLVGMAEWALSSLADALGVELTADELHEAAVTLI